MRNIHVIVPAAGESRRFAQKGIKTPKPLIQFSWKDHPKQTMLRHAIYGASEFPLHVGVQEEKKLEFEMFFGQRSFLHPVDNSLGQADTVRQIVEDMGDDVELLIVNTDSMFLYPLKTFLKQVEGFEGAAIVFDGEYSPAFSYIDSYPLFNRTAEKEPISQWAMAGAFYFKSKKDFLEAYNKYHATSPKEEYLSEVYNYLEGEKLAVFIPREQWILWGTAEDLLSDEHVNELEF